MKDLNYQALRKFAKGYLEIVTGPMAGINLTRILNEDDFFTKQVLDSVLPLVESEVFASEIEKSDTIVDVGFGGGFPILPLACLFPEKKFVGFEARRKKADAVNEIARELGIKNVACHHERIENIELDQNCLVTFKAVGKVQDFLVRVNSSKDAAVFFYKGPSVEELEEIHIVDGWELKSDDSFDVPGTDGRRLLGYVPRRTSGPIGPTKQKSLKSKKNKNLVKLSSLSLP